MSRLSHPEVFGGLLQVISSVWQSPCTRTSREGVGCPQLYSCRTLNGRPHKKPPMGSRSAVLNADCRKPAAVAKEKGLCSFFYDVPNSLQFAWLLFFLYWYISTTGRGKTSLSRILLDYCRRLSQTAKRTPAGNPWGHFAGQVSCVRRESAAVNGQEQNGLI